MASGRISHKNANKENGVEASPYARYYDQQPSASPTSSNGNHASPSMILPSSVLPRSNSFSFSANALQQAATGSFQQASPGRLEGTHLSISLDFKRVQPFDDDKQSDFNTASTSCESEGGVSPRSTLSVMTPNIAGSPLVPTPGTPVIPSNLQISGAVQQPLLNANSVSLSSADAANELIMAHEQATKNKLDAHYYKIVEGFKAKNQFVPEVQKNLDAILYENAAHNIEENIDIMAFSRMCVELNSHGAMYWQHGTNKISCATGKALINLDDFRPENFAIIEKNQPCSGLWYSDLQDQRAEMKAELSTQFHFPGSIIFLPICYTAKHGITGDPLRKLLDFYVHQNVTKVIIFLGRVGGTDEASKVSNILKRDKWHDVNDRIISQMLDKINQINSSVQIEVLNRADFIKMSCHRFAYNHFIQKQIAHASILKATNEDIFKRMSQKNELVVVKHKKLSGSPVKTAVTTSPKKKTSPLIMPMKRNDNSSGSDDDDFSMRPQDPASAVDQKVTEIAGWVKDQDLKESAVERLARFSSGMYVGLFRKIAPDAQALEKELNAMDSTNPVREEKDDEDDTPQRRIFPN
jgi:hypothetical protein